MYDIAFIRPISCPLGLAAPTYPFWIELCPRLSVRMHERRGGEIKASALRRLRFKLAQDLNPRPRAGPDKLYLLKTDARNLDHGTPEDVRRELLRLRDLHRRYPGLFIYPGGGRKPECVEAFHRCYNELLVYG